MLYICVNRRPTNSVQVYISQLSRKILHKVTHIFCFQCKEEKVRNLFGEKGVITDCTLKYSKDGVFRKFAFVGYKTEKEAQEAVKHFNKSYMNTSKLQVKN